MTKFVRVAALAALPVVLFAASASAQQEKKETGKPRLPNYWKQLDLSEEQRDRYYQMAGTREKQIDALKSDIEELQTKLSSMRKQLKELDDGDSYLTILTPQQRDKLAKLKTESAKRSADKAVAKAKEMEKSGGKAPKGTVKKVEKSEKKPEGKAPNQ